MSRVMVLAVCVLTGCAGSQSDPGPVDAFFGRTRVSPPATGAVSRTGPPSDPSYGSSPTSSTRATSQPLTTAYPGQAPGQAPGVPATPAGASGWKPSPAPGGASSGGSGGAVEQTNGGAGAGTQGGVASSNSGDRVVIPRAAREIAASPDYLPRPTSEPVRVAAVPTGLGASPTAARSATGATSSAQTLASPSQPITRVLNPRPKDLGSALGNAPRPLDLPSPEGDSLGTATAGKATPSVSADDPYSGTGARR
jgi:hypothetical protein